MKFFLLTAGDHYYPSHGSGDWIATFATHEEAEGVVTKVSNHLTNHFADDHYIIYGCRYDWYSIIDLKDWVQS